MNQPLTVYDDAGRTWHLFSVTYHHPLDNQTFSFSIYAIDHADAEERLEFIKHNAFVDGKIIEVQNANDRKN